MVTRWTSTSDLDCALKAMKALKPMKPLPMPALFAAALAGLLWAGAAQAQIWAYIDERGVAHFSNARLDERYELFVQGGSVLEINSSPPDAPQAPQQPRPEPASVSPAQSRLMHYLTQSPRYKAVQHLLKEAAQTHRLEPELLQALIAAESGFDTQAVSPKGAVGLMQLMAPTAARYGVKSDRRSSIAQKLTDPAVNLRAGTRYLRDLMAMFPGRLDLALAAYNAGEGAVQRAGNKIPNYPETQNYVKTVLQLYAFLKPQVLQQADVPPVVGPAGAAAMAGVTVVPGRVRMEMVGGASGRGNMLPDAGPQLLLRSAPVMTVLPASGTSP
jgi:soluble lytic murein transglycosylase-like protein